MWCRKTCVLITKPFFHRKFYKNVLSLRQLHTSLYLPAGHSKWENIRHIKALKDGQKSAIFTKYSRQIRLAIQGGSADPALNVTLRNVIDDALRKNMPMATIQNSIKKSTQSNAILKKQYLYWRFQQKIFGICVLYTDNFAQLKQELAPVMRKSGTVYVDGQHIFDDFGLIEAACSDNIKSKVKSSADLEQVCTEDAIECGVEEVEVVDHINGAVNFMCNPLELNTITGFLRTKGYIIENAQHVFIPKTTVKLSEDGLKAYQTFVKKLRDVPGIEDIYDNLEFNTD